MVGEQYHIEGDCGIAGWRRTDGNLSAPKGASGEVTSAGSERQAKKRRPPQKAAATNSELGRELHGE